MPISRRVISVFATFLCLALLPATASAQSAIARAGQLDFFNLFNVSTPDAN